MPELDASPADQPGRKGLGAPDEPAYGFVLVILLALYVVVSVSDREWLQPILFALAAVALAIAVLPERINRRWWLLATAFVLVAFVISVLVAVWPSGWRVGLVDVAIAILMLSTGFMLIRGFIARSIITPATVFGAIDVYLLIGLAFSFLFHGMQSWSGDPFFASSIEGTRNTFTYFSFVSLTTLGYGDLTPASDGGRSVAVVEVVVGQILLITVIARLVSLMRFPSTPTNP